MILKWCGDISVKNERDVLQCDLSPSSHHRVTEIRLTFGIDAEFLTISILNFTFVNINTTSAVVPESRRTLTMIRSVRIDTLSTRAKLIIFIALVNVQTFVHFRTKFHSRRTFTAVINSWSCNMNSCVWSNYYFIFRQRITLMRTFIILLITSIDSFTCPEIRFCSVFQRENSNQDPLYVETQT